MLNYQVLDVVSHSLVLLFCLVVGEIRFCLVEKKRENMGLIAVKVQ